ncbi:PTS sugar transporter subunit IIC [Enterococcus faecalis]|uniref:PTS mannose/fructose/sorbose/N-acetylgalactosamine transporter subunit IIC n=1 Tax=Enterococcus faecalis TaxID=1351 RepID=UPI001141B674|nr:PTS sugar transporter subunit IIC [Enterococcus faecalis]NSV63205.1 PTS sugar transporter subunit IIC [Enterococcus faecalis]TQA67044.1 PTS sugar transporter subunit IIC [Enterococcus faecalis]
MFFQSIALGLIGVFCILDSRVLGRLNFERPLIVSTLVGLVLGDLEKGLMVGASLELMSLGLVNIGAAAPPDMIMASIIATAFAILSGSNAETALTIAIPISVLGQMLGILMRTVLSNLTHHADVLIAEGKFGRARQIHIVYGVVLYSLMYFIPIFLAIYFGTDLVKSIVDSIPKWLTDGLTLASKILPAYGFALLLQTMLTKKMIPFLLLGFLITAYSGLSITGIAAFACIVAFVMAQVNFGRKKFDTEIQGESDPLDDL